ncbi:hypothetical protein SAMN06265795_10213 [Noviherbaspirillum humi]|uniref:Uncharacterized protein n=1 Tax=Noviherbaspirillum humi TaxID=1688639 RepID=A0A239D5G2_9BURK|nr:hypothetical protein [Noviherbaspirillum humi]SNS27590.1 hypothetical protein SAMN06265795_10213 [Noviherbaspirillum humi]
MARVDDTAYQLENLVDAACEYGIVMELLTVIHELCNRRQLLGEDNELLNVASVAALLARAQRQNLQIDS